MNAYPVNALEAASMSSPQKEPYSQMKDLHNRYIEYSVDFNSPNIAITGTWNGLIEIDSMILGNTNALSGHVELFNGNNLLHDETFSISGYLTIINFDKMNVNKFILHLSGNENISAGLLFFGMKWVLPRFVVAPSKGLALRNEGGRTFTGQATGFPVETLRTFSASYQRIPNEEKKKFDDYINGVQTVIPHAIDPYPEAHDEFEPFFATVESYGEAEKREENGFFWNFECSWQEAK